MQHNAIRTFEDAVEYLDGMSLETFAHQQRLDAIDLRDPLDRRAVKIALINHARGLRDFTEQQ
jgi:hypothetical protein